VTTHVSPEPNTLETDETKPETGVKDTRTLLESLLRAMWQLPFQLTETELHAFPAHCDWALARL
jgi:hypothetical protein